MAVYMTADEKTRQTVLRFAITLSLVMMSYFFMASFIPAEKTNLDVVKSILPFMYVSCGLLWGYYWGTSSSSAGKDKIIDKQNQNAADITKSAIATAPSTKDRAVQAVSDENIAQLHELLEKEKQNVAPTT